MNMAKRLFALLLVLSMFLALCGCGTENLAGTVADTTENQTEEESGEYNNLLDDFSDSLTMSDGTSFLDSASGTVTALPPGVDFPPMVGVDDDFASKLFKDVNGYDNVASVHDKTVLRRWFRRIDSSATLYIAEMVGYEIASYCVDQIATSILTSMGLDMRSSNEIILEHLQIVDDIYASVLRIEEKVNEINELMRDGQYYTAIAERQGNLTRLYYATNEKYLAVIEALSEGYEEFEDLSTKFAALDALDDSGNGDLSDEDFNALIDASPDVKFFLTYAFMESQGGTSLYNYMIFNLMYGDTDANAILEDWAGQYVAGTNILDTVKNLLLSYSGGTSLNSKSYPEIYDYVAYTTCAWEHEGYDYREAIRELDSSILDQAATMEYIYYTMVSVSGTVLGTDEEINKLQSCIENYNEVQENHKVVRHEDYYICQIPGCEYVFAKYPVYYDYYSQFKNTLNDICLHNSSTSKVIRSEALTALESLFRNTAIAYRYELLDESQKSKFTYNHDEIGDAADPYGKIDWDYISTFATVDTKNVLYLPQSAYEALFDYYKGKNYSNLYDLIATELGITFYNYTFIVCNVEDDNCSYSAPIFSTTIQYYSPQFRVTQKTASKNKDFIDVRTCLTDDVKGVRNIRFADGLNLKNYDKKFNNWGSAKNRFGGLMVLGVPFDYNY